VKTHAGVIAGGFGDRSIYSIALGDTAASMGAIRRGALLVGRNVWVEGLARLNRFEAVELTKPGFPSVHVAPGWYLNVADLFINNRTGGLRTHLGAVWDEPEIAWNTRFSDPLGTPLLVLPTGDLQPGYYALITSVRRRQRADVVIGGETQPKHVLIFSVGDRTMQRTVTPARVEPGD
jgi:hypothetical protein